MVLDIHTRGILGNWLTRAFLFLLSLFPATFLHLSLVFTSVSHAFSSSVSLKAEQSAGGRPIMLLIGAMSKMATLLLFGGEEKERMKGGKRERKAVICSH